MAERTPVVKKYRDALENVISATMDFLAKATHTSQDQASTANLDLPNEISVSSPTFSGTAPESYVRGSPKAPATPVANGDVIDPGFDNNVFGYLPQAQLSPGAEGRSEGRHGEMGQMDAEWMLSLCEGDGFSLQMLNEMMRFEPSLGA